MDNGASGTKAKMSGYLHLKIKKRMIPFWKSYWFVLEDRLLLYYRSKDEYQAISPCKGSINLGPPCELKCVSSVSNAFQIETRTTTYTLKAENSDEQKKWMQSLLSALPQNYQPAPGLKQQTVVAYSLENLVPKTEPNDFQVLRKRPFARQNTMPNRFREKSDDIIQRLQKIGAHSYGGSLEAISKIATKKTTSPTLDARNSASKGSLPDYYHDTEEQELLRPHHENIYERISGDSQTSARDSFASFLVDNDNYSVPLRKSGDSNFTRETKSLLVENEQYVTTPRNVFSEEVIYAEPKIAPTDCNKNSVLVENSLYAVVDARPKTENVYEDLENYNLYAIPTVPKQNKKVKSASSGRAPLSKSRSFIKRVWKKRHKKVAVEEEIYAEIDTVAEEKIEMNDGSALQMLSELQNILENKKVKLRVTASTSSQTESETPNSQNSLSSTEPPSSPLSLEPQRPSLPPKTKISPQPNPLQTRSLDEILEDLDREKIESKPTVQMLIQKFSEPDDVVLRNKPDVVVSHRHSDDLNKLLDQLTQVTCAPIMTPGVTSSLVNPNLGDEWLKLLPKRERRLSEPDYDIPRPHKTLQLPAESQSSDAIPATRFLGPVMSTDKEDESLCVSMTPDSLEVENLPTHHSYSSHCYPSQDDTVIYALPKSYISVATHVVNTCSNHICAPDDCTIIYKNVKNVTVSEEIFADSLELCNEASTGF